MDPLKSEIIRARQVLDRMEGGSKGDLDVYRALDALWQCLYFMMLEAGGVVGVPAPEAIAKSMERLMDEKRGGDGSKSKTVEGTLDAMVKKHRAHHGQYL